MDNDKVLELAAAVNKAAREVSFRQQVLQGEHDRWALAEDARNDAQHQLRAARETLAYYAEHGKMPEPVKSNSISGTIIPDVAQR